mgnify:FL=1
MSRSLYELTSEAIILQEALMAEGIDDDTQAAAMAAYWEGETEAKLEGYAKLIRSLEADAATFRNEKAFWSDKQSRVENTVTRLKSALLAHLTSTGRVEASAGLFTIKVQDNPEKVNVFAADRIPGHLGRVEFIPDKAAIKDAIKAGETVPGCELVREKGVRIK